MTVVAGMIIGYLSYDSSASVWWNIARTAAGIVAMLIVWYVAKGVL